MTKKMKKSDPHADREAKKYASPIVSREFILALLEEQTEPLTFRRVAEAFEISDDDGLEALRRRLRAMERDGQLVRNRRGGYGVPSEMDLIAGHIIGHADGYGFMSPDDGGDDLFLSAKQMRAVFHGDRVMAQVMSIDKRGRREGRIVEVLEHRSEELIGRFYIEGGLSFVVPDNKRISQDIMIPVDNQGSAKSGQVVVAVITQQPTIRTQAVGRITEVIGDHLASGMEREIAIRSHQIPNEWSDAVEAEAAEFGSEVKEASFSDRVDIRDLPLVTIDGEDSRDFDDAVFCEPHNGGWRLLVAIADVSSYVKPGAALDESAWERGNSVYFPQTVVPMLPEALSNGLCSLNPDVNRLCLVCEMFISAEGVKTEHRFFEAVMRSHARLTYTKVAAMLEGDQTLRDEYGELVPHVENLYALYHALRNQREVRGAIDFDRTETKIVFNDDGKIDCIEPVVRNDAHKLIEECMITANVAAAEYLLKHKMPVVYRVHQEPNEDKITDVRAFLGELGLRLTGKDKPDAIDYARLLASVVERPDRHLIETVMLRSLSQAVYSPENLGHFGLSLDAYAHFTSPIRRYPDLVVHRAIRHLLSGGKADDFYARMPDMQMLGEHTSMTERRADEATRDTITRLKCEYMLDKVGEEFDGIITAVTGFGLFVELDNIYVEGLVHVTALENDYYHFDPVKHRMLGENMGKSYRLGDKIRIQVARVDLDERKIDFVMPGAGLGKSRAAEKTGKGKGKGKVDAKADGKDKKKFKKKFKKKKRVAKNAKADDKPREQSKAKHKSDPESKSSPKPKSRFKAIAERIASTIAKAVAKSNNKDKR